jgi:hypothetical protein
MVPYLTILAVNTYPGKLGEDLVKLSTVYNQWGGPMTKVSREPTDTGKGSAPVPTVEPLAPGTRKDCDTFIDGNDYQSWDKDIWDSSCQLAMTMYSMEFYQMQRWNPSQYAPGSKPALQLINIGLSNMNIQNCTLTKEFRYCVQLGSHKERPFQTVESLPTRV